MRGFDRVVGSAVVTLAWGLALARPVASGPAALRSAGPPADSSRVEPPAAPSLGERHEEVLRAVAAHDARDALAALAELARADPEAYAANHYAYLEGTLAAEAGDEVRALDALRPLAAAPGSLCDRATLRLATLLERAFPKQALHHVEGFATRFRGSAVEGEASLLEVVLHARTGDWPGADRRVLSLKGGRRREAEQRLFAVARDTGSRVQARERARRLLRARFSDEAAGEAAAYLSATGIASLPSEEVWRLAQALVASRAFVPALAALEHVAATSPALRADALFLLARAAVKAGDEARARCALGTLAAMPGGPRGRAELFLARVELSCGETDEAIERLRALADDGDPRSLLGGQATVKLARIACGARDLGAARAHLGDLIRRFGASSSFAVDTAIDVAGVALAVGDSAGALHDLDQVAAAHGDAARDLAYWRGVALELEGRPAEAAAELRKPARGRDLLARLARDRVARLPGAGDEAARLLAAAREALARGDSAGARRLAGEALADGSGGATERDALLVLREAYRALPGYREVFTLALDPPRASRTTAPAAVVGTPPTVATSGKRSGSATARAGVDHEAAAADLRYLGLDAEASQELRAAGGVDLARAYAIAELARRGGDARSSLAWGERLLRRLPSDFEKGCLPGHVLRLLYPDPYASMVDVVARARGLDPDIVRSVMREESRFDPDAVSPAGARGLMQFIPETARRVGDAIGMPVRSASDVQQPGVAIPLGAAYLADLLRTFGGNEGAAVAAYNAGEEASFSWLARTQGGPLDEFLREIEFAETRTYVDRVLTSLAAYRAQRAMCAAN